MGKQTGMKQPIKQRDILRFTLIVTMDKKRSYILLVLVLWLPCLVQVVVLV